MTRAMDLPIASETGACGCGTAGTRCACGCCDQKVDPVAMLQPDSDARAAT